MHHLDGDLPSVSWILLTASLSTLYSSCSALWSGSRAGSIRRPLKLLREKPNRLASRS